MASEDGRHEYRGLLVDYGGVLTTSPFDSFAEFCAQEGVPLTPSRARYAATPAAASC